VELDARARRLRAALGFLRLPATEPELQLLHRCSAPGPRLVDLADAAALRYALGRVPAD